MDVYDFMVPRGLSYEGGVVLPEAKVRLGSSLHQLTLSPSLLPLLHHLLHFLHLHLLLLLHLLHLPHPPPPTSHPSLILALNFGCTMCLPRGILSPVFIKMCLRVCPQIMYDIMK